MYMMTTVGAVCAAVAAARPGAGAKDRADRQHGRADPYEDRLVRHAG
jgi:hypothetical protein